MHLQERMGRTVRAIQNWKRLTPMRRSHVVAVVDARVVVAVAAFVALFSFGHILYSFESTN